METIYATAPFWAWVNPALLRLLIEPPLRWHQDLSVSRLNYVVDDLGDTYPLATGPSSLALNSPKSLESTGDMMIITSALVRATGDTSIVSTYVSSLSTGGTCAYSFHRPLCTKHGETTLKTMPCTLVLSMSIKLVTEVVN
jgi:hypothetical protein